MRMRLLIPLVLLAASVLCRSVLGIGGLHTVEPDAYIRMAGNQGMYKAGGLDAEKELEYAQVLFDLNRLDAAMKHVEAVLERDPLNLHATTLRGAVHCGRGDHLKAEEDLGKALRLDGESSRAYYYLGVNELAQKRLPTAVEYLGRAVGLSPASADAHFKLAEALRLVGGMDNRRRALTEYTTIIENAAKKRGKDKARKVAVDVYLNRGQLYFENTQYREALLDFQYAMEVDPTRRDLVVEYAKTLQRMNKTSDARIYLEDILDRGERYPAARYQLAQIELKEGHKSAAEDHLEKVVAQGPSLFPEAHRDLGFLYKEKRLVDLSCGAFKRYLRFSARDAVDREEIARLIEGMCRR